MFTSFRATLQRVCRERFALYEFLTKWGSGDEDDSSSRPIQVSEKK